MGRVLSYEAKALGRRLEREARRLKAAAERELISHEVIETADDVTGDLCSLLLNAKPAHLTEDQWLHELERRGTVKVRTMRRWLHKKDEMRRQPQSESQRSLLHALGLDYYIGRRR